MQSFNNISLSLIHRITSPQNLISESANATIFSLFTVANLLFFKNHNRFRQFDSLIIFNFISGMARTIFPLSKQLAATHIISMAIIILIFLLKSAFIIISESNIREQSSFIGAIKAIYSKIKEKIKNNEDDLIMYALFVLSMRIITVYIFDTSSLLKNLNKLITILLIIALCAYNFIKYTNIKYQNQSSGNADTSIDSFITVSVLRQQLSQREREIGALENQMQEIISRSPIIPPAPPAYTPAEEADLPPPYSQ